MMVIAGGAWSGEVGRRIGLGDPNYQGILGCPIPIEPRYLLIKLISL